jgi:hypothetical protein
MGAGDAAGAKPQTIVFVIHYADGTEARAIQHQADVFRMESRYGPEWQERVNTHPLETFYFLAWLTSRRDDTRPTLDFDDWADTVESVDWKVETIAPFVVEPPSASPPSWRLPPPADAQTHADGLTPIRATP